MTLHATSRAAGLLRLALVLAFSLGPAVADAARVVDVRIALHPEFTRVVFETDVPTEYRIERQGEVVLVRFGAGSAPQRIRWPGPRLSAVALEAVPSGSVARISARDEVSIEELVLENPPRIVLDLRVREAEARPTDAASVPAETPESAESAEGGTVESAEPSAPAEAIAPDETRPLEVVEPAETEPVEAAESAEPEPAETEAVEAEPVETQEPADTEPVPAETSEPVVSPAPPRPEPEVAWPPPTAKPRRSERPPVASAPPKKGRGGLLLVGAVAALAAVGAVVFGITFRLLRHRPQESNGVRLAELVEIDESPPRAREPAATEMEHGLAEAEPAATETEPELAEAEPGAIEMEPPLERAELGPEHGAPEIDQVPPERQEGAPMSQEPEVPKAQRPEVRAPHPPEPGATAPAEDALQLIQSLERRVFQLEGRLDEAVDAKHLLERQLASQAEELRVQRATLARVQRVLRTLSAPESSSRSYPVHH